MDWIKSLELPSTVHSDLRPTSRRRQTSRSSGTETVRGGTVKPVNGKSAGRPAALQAATAAPRRFTSHYYTKITTYILYIYTCVPVYTSAQQLVRGELMCYIGDYTERPLVRIEKKSNVDRSEYIIIITY